MGRGRLGLHQGFGPICGTRAPRGRPTFAIGAWVGGTTGCPMDNRPHPLRWVFARRGWWRSGSPIRFSAPLEGWRCAVRRVAMILASIEEHRGDPVLRGWKASSSGHCRNLAAAPCRDARAVVPSDPLTFRICVQDRSAVPQKSSHIVGMLSPILSIGP